jgi:hypothetical protein
MKNPLEVEIRFFKSNDLQTFAKKYKHLVQLLMIKDMSQYATTKET